MIGHPRASATAPAAIAVSGDVGSVSATYIGTQMVGASAVPVAVAAKDPGPVFAAAGVDRFTGREWLAGEVDRFLAEYPCGYVFLTAEAGLGKTAFAAWLVKTRGYLSHFSRYAGGRSMRAALQNLSAQLIRSCGLGDQAPGGMLPDWTQTPAGFESLLGMAAGRAGQQGRGLVVVVDGLDEAEPSADALPFGLPLLLPAGVFVIGTYRTGYVLRQPGAPVATIPILKDDPRNRDDIRQFLREAVSEDVLAARLAEAGIDPAAFAAELAARCGGVWVYLRYVLQELRIGLRQPAAISELPSGLRGYYADQIRIWQDDPAWDTVLLPVAATLAVAGEPLPAAVLARLAGDLDPAAVRRLCNFTFRPLLTTLRAGSVPQYEIYHASFREVLKARDHDGPGAPGDEVPGGLEELADELTQAAQAAHCRAADAYLIGFGGLDTGLSLLAADPGAAAIDDGYPLRHLARHLDHAGRHRDLHQLLAASRAAAGERVSNVWFAAHDYADCVSSYLDDLTRARQASARATDRSVARNQLAPTLGTEVRYALMAASIHSRTTSIPPDLLELLIAVGVWSPARGLDHARRLTNPASRFQALMTVHTSGTHDSTSLAEALAAATTIRDDYARARALTGLAPHLPADQQPGVLGQALAAATILSDSDRARALTALAPHLPADQQPGVLGQALAAATTLIGSDRARALTALAPHLPADLLGQALAAATILIGSDRVQALTALAPHLPAGLLGPALAAATALSDDSARARALTALAPHLPPDQQPGVLGQALAAAALTNDNYARAEALTALAPHLPAGLLGQALATATAISDGNYRAWALTALAPHLPAGLLGPALAAATALSDDSARARALTALAPHLPPDQQPGVLGQALAAAALTNASAPTSDSARAEALTALAPHLPADLLGQALATATAISDGNYRAWALTCLAPHLPADQQPGVLSQALAAATAITSDLYRAEALTGLAPHLPADLLGPALAAATALSSDSARARALTGLAPHLPADQQPGVLSQALAAATALSDNYARARALTGLAPHLPADQQPGVLSQALAAATALSNDDGRIQALTALAPHLPADQQPGVLSQALAAATAISYDPDRVPGADRAGPAPARRPARPGADRRHRHRPRQRHRPHRRLTPRPGADRAGPAPARRPARPGAGRRHRHHQRLLPRRGADRAGPAPARRLLGQALAAATAITSDLYRAEALTGLAPHLPAGQQPGVLSQALAAATAISDDYARTEALTGLAPHLPAGLLGPALAAATALSNDFYRAEALTGLAPHLPACEQPGVLSQALAAATDSWDDYARARALTGLAPHLPADQQPGVLSQALAAATAISDDDGRIQALTALAPHLPADQQPGVLSQALAAATAISDDYARARALTGLAPHLPAWPARPGIDGSF